MAEMFGFTHSHDFVNRDYNCMINFASQRLNTNVKWVEFWNPKGSVTDSYHSIDIWWEEKGLKTS